jgi:hypothetical protein
MALPKTNHSKKYVLPFAKKMNITAIGILICGGIIAAPIVWSSGGKTTTPLFGIAKATEVIVWFYLSAILFQFYRRTQLREYILNTHTYWLAGVIAYPINYLFGSILYLFRNGMQPNLYTFSQITISSTWLILWLVGIVLRQRRAKQMEVEIQKNASVWKHLINMKLKSIALLQFPLNS